MVNFVRWVDSPSWQRLPRFWAWMPLLPNQMCIRDRCTDYHSPPDASWEYRATASQASVSDYGEWTEDSSCHSLSVLYDNTDFYNSRIYLLPTVWLYLLEMCIRDSTKTILRQKNVICLPYSPLYSLYRIGNVIHNRLSTCLLYTSRCV